MLLPLSRTSIAALFVIQFIYGWNQYLWPLLVTTDETMYPIVLGIQRHTSPGGVWRLGLSANLSSSDAENTARLVSPDTTLVSESDEDVYSVGLELTRLSYPRPAERMAVYYGAGPYFQSTDRKNVDTQSP